MARSTIQLPDEFLFTTRLPVRITDINYGGHVGNDTLLSFLQEARLQFLNQYGFSEQDVAGCGIIMADAVMIYKSQAFYKDVLQIGVTVTDFSRHACDILYKITKTDSDQEVLRAKTRIAFFDYEKQTLMPVPEKFRELFLKDQ